MGGKAGPITRKGFSKNVKLEQQTVALGVDEVYLITEWNLFKYLFIYLFIHDWEPDWEALF